MKIELTPEELEKLLAYTFVGYQVIAGNKDLRHEMAIEDQDFVNELYAQAYNEGCDLVEFFDGEFVPTEDFEDALMAEIEEYEEDITFENVTDWLAQRDIADDYSAEEIEAMTDDEFDELVEDYGEAYAEEFSEFGLENLHLVDDE
jgi:hypothetical protein